MEERYTRIERLGSGANGTVYKAFDKHLYREVAIKKVGREETWAWKEAEVLKKLKHPAIPIIYDVLKEGEDIGIVMEYMEGNNLLSVLEEGEMFSEEKAVQIGICIGECLQYLHNLPEKIIYRDLKPANLLLDEKGDIKLIDFDGAFVGGNRRQEKVYAGTFGYSAPEQFEHGEMVDERSDIYGFGATLYHILTGRNPSKPPYRLYKIREVNPFISEKLEQIVEKCMEKEKEKRYENMETVLEELRNYDKKLGKRKRYKRRSKYMIEEKKNVFLTCKKGGGLFVLIFFMLFIIGIQKETRYAQNIQEETKILPLIVYNQKREKIIIRDGTFYEVEGDFYMALPIKALDGEKGTEVTVICKNLESGEIMEKVVLLKVK